MPTDTGDTADRAGGGSAAAQFAGKINAFAEARAALDVRLRTELGRRLTIVLLLAPLAVGEAAVQTADEATNDVCARFQAEIAAYGEVRLLTTRVPQTSAFTTTFTAMCAPMPPTTSQTLDAALEVALRDAQHMDADAVLVWRDALREPAEAPQDDTDNAWLRTVTDTAERLNLFDAATLALIGPDESRAQARALGYEDGFALTEPLATSVYAALVRLTDEALTRAEYRQKGSSPPCYL